jgi:hypothetical protein
MTVSPRGAPLAALADADVVAQSTRRPYFRSADKLIQRRVGKARKTRIYMDSRTQDADCKNERKAITHGGERTP